MVRFGLSQATSPPCSRASVVCKADTGSRQQRRQHIPALTQQCACIAAACVLSLAPGTSASGLESVDLPMPDVPKALSRGAQKGSDALKAAEDTFQNSDLLGILRSNSDENRAKNKKAISDKYCQRQGEMGVGDCGGLRFIPGATKNGKQKTPEWLAKILGDFKDETRDSNRVEIRNEQKRQLGGD